MGLGHQSSQEAQRGAVQGKRECGDGNEAGWSDYPVGTHVAVLSTQSIVFSIRGVNASQNRWFPDVVRNRR